MSRIQGHIIPTDRTFGPLLIQFTTQGSKEHDARTISYCVRRIRSVSRDPYVHSRRLASRQTIEGTTGENGTSTTVLDISVHLGTLTFISSAREWPDQSHDLKCGKPNAVTKVGTLRGAFWAASGLGDGNRGSSGCWPTDARDASARRRLFGGSMPCTCGCGPVTSSPCHISRLHHEYAHEEGGPFNISGKRLLCTAWRAGFQRSYIWIGILNVFFGGS